MKIARKTACLLTCLLTFILCTPVQAATPEKLVQVRLMAEHGAVKPGNEIWVAVEQSIKPGWHTYWKNPGDSGTAPRIKWTLPQDFTMGDIQWPVPRKMTVATLTNYGYEGGAILLQKLKVPQNIPDGPLTIEADTEILVCQEECIPEYGTYKLTLNDDSDEDNSAYFAEAESKLPQTAPWTATFTEQDKNFSLAFPADAGNIAGAQFIPADWGIIANTAAPEIKDRTLRQKRGDRPLGNISETSGLLIYKDGRAVSFTATPASSSPPPLGGEGKGEGPGIVKAIILALLGGLILNLMPCVFPVLSIKALSLVKISEKQPRLAQAHGLAYTAGVVLSFLFIAGLLIAFRAGGAEIGWGFQLQNTTVVTLLAWLLFVIGLNLCGLFELSGRLDNFGNKLTQGEGVKNSFFTGILATLVATPCTAPFMAAAIGAALLQPPAISLIIFAALGFGLALPYLALSYIPALQQKLPRPGAWMENFRQLLAFPMFASSAWLIWVLSQQAGPMGVFGGMMGLVLIAFGIWLLRHEPRKKYWRYKVRLLALTSFALAVSLVPAAQMASPANPAQPLEFGAVFNKDKLETLLKGKDPVFVEMTAAWCITCKVNHAVALDTAATRRVFADNHVQYLVGDWTKQDAAITEYLNSFGRNGVPLYVFYGPPGPDGKRPEPRVLPQILTPGIVAGAVKN